MLAAFAVAVSACAGSAGEVATTTTTAATTTPATTPSAALDETVTAESVEDGIASDIGVDADARIITLGVLADLTGPFASLSTDITDAFTTYWDVVNAAGGIDDWTVRLEIANTRGDPQMQQEAYESLRSEVLAFGLAVGSDANAAVIDAHIADDMLLVPVSWYSGWPFRSVDGGVALEQYTNYCLEAMNAIDFADEQGAASVAIVTNAGLYGEDAAAGARIAVDGYGLSLAYDAGGAVELGDDLGPVIRGVVASGADWTFLATNPAVTPQIIAGAVQAGYQGQFIGAAPSYDPRILDAASAELFAGRFFQSAYVVAWGDSSPGNRAMMDAMRAAYPDRRPSDAFIVGWNAGHTMRTVLAEAIADGDLSRPALIAIANSLDTVPFAGAAPDQGYVGTPDVFAARATAIHRPDLTAYLAAGGPDQTLADAEATTGSVLVRPFTVGAVAATHGFTEPCVPVDGAGAG